MWHKKIISLCLCFVLLLGSAIPVKADLERLRFEDGQIKMAFLDKKATTGTTYKTAGWIIHKSAQGNRDAYHKEAFGVMIGEDFQEKSSEPAGSNVRTRFEINKEAVDYALTKAELGGIPSGQVVYLDSVFEVYKNGVSQGKKYFTNDAIKNAAPWGSQSIEDLKSYYNVPIPYSSALHPLDKRILVNGKEVSKETVTKLETGKTYNIKFGQTIDYQGSTAEIRKSYFYYNNQQGQKLFEVSAPDPKVTDRNPTMNAGGITVVAEYAVNPKVKVQHFDLDTNKIMEEEEIIVSPGATVTRSSKQFTGRAYIYSATSENNGSSWEQRSDAATRNIIVNNDTILRFNYSANSDLYAMLNLTADPQAIEKGKTAAVKFTLDASASKAKNGIKKYEFWFGATKDFNRNPDYTVTTPKQLVTKQSVAPKSRWYGKVRITDAKGATSEAEAEVTIEELQPEPIAEITPWLKLNLIQDTDMIQDWNGEEKKGRCRKTEYIQNGAEVWYGMDRYQVEVYVPADYKDKNGRYKDVTLNFTMDATDSESTNGIGNYKFTHEGKNGGTLQDGGSPVTNAFSITLPQSPQDVMDGKYSNDYYDSQITVGYCTMTDSVVPTAKVIADVSLQYRYVFEKAPTVTLKINKNNFALGETAEFTPGFTYEDRIQSKTWSIQNTDGTTVENGTGEIPATYRMDLAVGSYTARQYIYYQDRNHNDLSAYAEVKFNVYNISPPDVSIDSDKEKYVIPTEGYFTVEYVEDEKYTYQIVDKSYRLKHTNGQVIIEGKGEFPASVPFTIDMDGGNYIAEQTIYWWQNGEYKSKTATCEFKLISPIPVAEFHVNMKMSTKENDWMRIDVPDKKGKVYKQIRIDLTPSIAYNAEMENPNSMVFTSPNTQIQIIPQDAESQSKIYTPSPTDMSITDGVLTVTGKQYIDVRFDEPGTYTIRCKVATAHFTSKWIQRDIVIREDLPPIVSFAFTDVNTDETGENTVLRDIRDLHVRFGVETNVATQDDDTIDYDSAKLQMRFDINANFDTADDGMHSDMYVTKAVDVLQDYVTIQKNDTMNKFDIDMYTKKFPILGKMYFEYSVAEKPTIPNFNAPSMPAAPVFVGTTEAIPTHKKVVTAENRAGNIMMELAKQGKIEIHYILGKDTPSIDIHALAEAYGENANIYLYDKYGNRQLIN